MSQDCILALVHASGSPIFPPPCELSTCTPSCFVLPWPWPVRTSASCRRFNVGPWISQPLATTRASATRSPLHFSQGFFLVSHQFICLRVDWAGSGTASSLLNLDCLNCCFPVFFLTLTSGPAEGKRRRQSHIPCIHQRDQHTLGACSSSSSRTSIITRLVHFVGIV